MAEMYLLHVFSFSICPFIYLSFIYPSVYEHFGCFLTLDIMNNSSTNKGDADISLRLGFCVFFFFWRIYTLKKGIYIYIYTFYIYREKEMAAHSSILAWKIPGMTEPGGLPFMGSHRVGHN